MAATITKRVLALLAAHWVRTQKQHTPLGLSGLLCTLRKARPSLADFTTLQGGCSKTVEAKPHHALLGVLTVCHFCETAKKQIKPFKNTVPEVAIVRQQIKPPFGMPASCMGVPV